MSTYKKYTDDELLDLLEACAEDLGRTPGQYAFNKWYGYAFGQNLLIRFGSWNKACELTDYNKKETKLEKLSIRAFQWEIFIFSLSFVVVDFSMPIERRIHNLPVQ